MTKPLFAAEKAAGQPVAEAGRKRVEAGGGFHQARAVDFAHRAVEGSADAGGKRLRLGQPEGAERFLVVAARVGMVEKGGLHRAGIDAGDDDTAAHELQPQGVSVAEQGVFACGVGGGFRRGDFARLRDDVDDVAVAARHHERGEGMDELDGREGVEAQHRRRFRVGRIACGLEDAAARVVDEDVDGRQARQPGGDGVGVREVERVQGDAGGAVASGGGLCEGVWPAGDEVQVMAACGGMAGEGGAKAAAGAGDEEGLCGHGFSGMSVAIVRRRPLFVLCCRCASAGRLRRLATGGCSGRFAR